MLEKKGKGTLAPWSPPKELIVSGPYKYVRNPMISGVLFAQLGVAFIFFNYWLFIWAVSFLVLNIIYFKLSEEPGLLKRFGGLYERYRKEVPMWFPVRIFRRNGGKDEGEE
jgi:protein-S-isoprenylcysteine O-methyltransferase Ste14